MDVDNFWVLFGVAHESYILTAVMSKTQNLAYIDGQNLHLGTLNADDTWKVDLVRFRVYLAQKYNVKRAYYYLGFTNDDLMPLYTRIQEAGFILYFKPHHETLASNKKGNVDTDLVFDIMETMYNKKDSFNKIILVSGDGDYMKMVQFLIGENKFGKILFPNQRKASSLYKQIDMRYRTNLSSTGTKNKIGK